MHNITKDQIHAHMGASGMLILIDPFSDRLANTKICFVPHGYRSGKDNITWYIDRNNLSSECLEKIDKLIAYEGPATESGYQIKFFSDSVTQGCKTVYFDGREIATFSYDPSCDENKISEEEKNKLIKAAVAFYLRNNLSSPSEMHDIGLTVRRKNGKVESTIEIEDKIVKVSINVPKNFSCESKNGIFHEIFSLDDGPFNLHLNIKNRISGFETLVNRFFA